jgi:hypothetical protein
MSGRCQPRKGQSVHPTPGTMSRVTREAAAASVQGAVRAAGGMARVVDVLWECFSDPSAAGRRAGLQETVKAALSEIQDIDRLERGSERCMALQSRIERTSNDLLALSRENESSSRVRAHATLMRSMDGDPQSLRTLAIHAEKVSPDFAATMAAACPP